MISIARKSLVFEWRRYMAATMALAFSGLLLLVQAGLLFGIVQSFTFMLDRSGVDLLVMSPNAEEFGAGLPLPSRTVGRLWMHPDVTDVRALRVGGGEWRRGLTKANVFLYGLDPDPASPTTLKGMPNDLVRNLARPGTIVVSRADLGKLNAAIGDAGYINGKRVTIVGAVDGLRGSFEIVAFGSPSTLRYLGAAEEGIPYYFLKIASGADAHRVRAELQPSGEARLFDVWLPEAMSSRSQLFFLLTSGAGATFVFSTILAIIIGIGVTSQTLRAAVLASLKEYAALRALGVGVGKLRGIILEQAFWVAVSGLIATIAATALVIWICGMLSVGFHLPAWLIGFTACFLVAVSAISGLLALRALYRSEPAELLR
jgi:putative ABC transport system permease protein